MPALDLWLLMTPSLFAKQLIVDSSKLRDFVEDNFKFDENGREKLENRQKTMWEKEKLLIMSNFSFSHSVFKRLVLQTCENKSLF